MDCTVLILACHVAVRNVNLSKNVIRDRMRTNAKHPSSFDLSTQGAFRHSIERRSPVFWQRSVIHTITAVKLKKKKSLLVTVTSRYAACVDRRTVRLKH